MLVAEHDHDRQKQNVAGEEHDAGEEEIYAGGEEPVGGGDPDEDKCHCNNGEIEARRQTCEMLGSSSQSGVLRPLH